MHEDILFHTQKWGLKVLNHFKDEKCGIIGVAGNHYMPKLPGSHWSSGATSYNIIGDENKILNWKFQDTNKNYLSAISVDGLWFCIPKKMFKDISFDEVTFRGFHCYDLDICMQIKNNGYDVRIIFDILIEHQSLGSRNLTWIENIFKAFHKWKKQLPLIALIIPEEKLIQGNFLNAKELLEQIRINKAPTKYVLQVWFYYLFSKPLIHRKKFFYLKKLITISNRCNK